MAFTTEFVIGAGGADVSTFTVGTFSASATAVHTFTLDTESHVAIVLAALPDPGNTGRWGNPTPYLMVQPSTGTPAYGTNTFRTALHSTSSTSPPVGERAMDNLNLSLAATLPPGTYQILVGSASDNRTYTLGESRLIITPT